MAVIETKVTWRGRDSLAAVELALRQHGRAEIRLPPEYHHALWRGFGKGGPGTPELLDVAGGSELLERIAGIDSLSELALLSAILGDAQLDVRVVSPSPVIRIDLRNAGGGAPGSRAGT